ncbi:hypothetical protein LTR50_001689 [Elasticomyces elasticus]|nr:hypothetical protein LTR50_001689 [Elasticomyces elasticus]
MFSLELDETVPRGIVVTGIVYFSILLIVALSLHLYLNHRTREAQQAVESKQGQQRDPEIADSGLVVESMPAVSMHQAQHGATTAVTPAIENTTITMPPSETSAGEVSYSIPNFEAGHTHIDLDGEPTRQWRIEPDERPTHTANYVPDPAHYGSADGRLSFAGTVDSLTLHARAGVSRVRRELAKRSGVVGTRANEDYGARMEAEKRCDGKA